MHVRNACAPPVAKCRQVNHPFVAVMFGLLDRQSDHTGQGSLIRDHSAPSAHLLHLMSLGTAPSNFCFTCYHAWYRYTIHRHAHHARGDRFHGSFCERTATALAQKKVSKNHSF